MSLIPSDFINSLITRTDIVELIGARVGLKKAGRNYQACCPFHDEKTPSFTVSAQKQFYYCFGCGAGGNAISFIMAHDRCEFVEAVESLAQMHGLEVPRTEGHKTNSPHSHGKENDLYEQCEKKSRYYQQSLKKSSFAIDYLKSREITGETAKKFRIGYAPDDLEYGKDPFHGRIVFPIQDRRGRVIGFGGRVIQPNQMPKYLNSPDSPIFHKSQVLYGLYQVREQHKNIEKILVVEGYMDVVMLAQHGIDFAVATLGTATTSDHIKALLQQTSHIVFCFDGDSAGRKAAWRALESALKVMRDDSKIDFLFLPDNEDPDSLVRQSGKAKFLTLLESAQSLPEFFFGNLKAQVKNFQSIEGRSAFAALAKLHLEEIPAQLFREMMIDKLSEIVHLDKSRLKFTDYKAHQFSGLQIHRTPMRLALALLLQNPNLASKVESSMLDNINLWHFEGSELFKTLFTVAHQHQKINTAGLLEHCRDTPEKEIQLLHKLAVWEHGVPEAGINSEWKDILDDLQKKHQKQQIEKLLQKSNLNMLTSPEKQELQQLLAEK